MTTGRRRKRWGELSAVAQRSIGVLLVCMSLCVLVALGSVWQWQQAVAERRRAADARRRTGQFTQYNESGVAVFQRGRYLAFRNGTPAPVVPWLALVVAAGLGVGVWVGWPNADQTGP